MASRKRIKPKSPVIVRDLEHANQVLGEIAHLKRNISAIETDMNQSIDRIKAAAEAFAAPRRSRLDALTAGLTAFAEYHKEGLFKKKRSVDLAFGHLGFRRSSEIKPKPRSKWALILNRIKELGYRDAIRIREDVNREALRDWPEERLAMVGARRMDKDLFWFELKEEGLGEGAWSGTDEEAQP
ncbi:MAG: host-nuclease inhibitor Gam family protein [Magnetococcales bacterium]|nr:host-nuclease inhibitor Gam family protein [Magnetococcales bacterium]